MAALGKNVVSLIILAAVGYGTYHFFMLRSSNHAGGAMPPTPVYTTQVKTFSWQPTYTTFGTIKAINGLVLTPEVSGRVSELPAQSGAHVDKGDVLVKINPDILTSDYANAQAAAELAKIKYERYQKLYQKKAVSSMDYDTARLDYKSAASYAKSLQAQLDQHLLKAPFSGDLGLVQIKLGSFVTAGSSEIVSLQQLSPIWIDLTVPQKLAGKVKQGLKASIALNAYPDEPEKATVLAVDPAINPSTRRASIRLITENAKHRLQPGAFVTVTLPLEKPIQGLKVPLLSVETEPSGDYVYVLEQPNVIKTKVVLGKQMSDGVLITSGLKEGQTIVTDGRMKMHPGAKAVDIATLGKKGSSS